MVISLLNGWQACSAAIAALSLGGNKSLASRYNVIPITYPETFKPFSSIIRRVVVLI